MFSGISKLNMPRIIVKPNSPSSALLKLKYNYEKKDILLMSHFIDNRAYSAIWFIENVWKKIQEQFPESMLHIYGALSESSDMRSHLKNTKNIIFHGFAPNLESAYKDKLLSVVPIFQNNGQRTRVSDSLSAGLPCFTTPDALSTIDGAVDKIHAVSSKDDKEMARNILEYISSPSRLKMLSFEGKNLMIKNSKRKKENSYFHHE